MKILAIETSTMLGGIAVADDTEGLIAEVRLNVKSTHSERLMAETAQVLKQSGLTVQDIDVFATAIGPGSFTGLRIGLSTVKGFAYATGKPIVAVPTLEAFAWNFPYCAYPVCPMLDARKKEVYAALFMWNGTMCTKLIDEVSVKVEHFLEHITSLSPSMFSFNTKGEGKSRGDHIVFIGEGALIYRDFILRAMGERALFGPLEKMVPSPANVASIGMQKALKEEFSEPLSLVPIYIRRSEAEIKWHD
jgi:tRNA threonylcarbamoyladenosine biosynthesis protein TsaB